MELFNTFKSPMINNDQPRNPIFKKIIDIFGELVDKEEIENDSGISVTDLTDTNYQNSPMMGTMGGYSSYGNIQNYLAYEESTKIEKLSVYRQMAEYAEIGYALETITNEVVDKNDQGDCAGIEIRNQEIVNHSNKSANIRKEWEHIYYDVLDFNRKGYELVFNFIVTGEMFLEKKIDFKHSERGILGIKTLQPDYTNVIWNNEDKIDGYFISDSINNGFLSMGKQRKKIFVTKENIAYANYGKFAYNPDNNEKIALSYLEPIKKVWRQLQLLEESVIIYRVVRAPDRRVFKIATGNLPKAQAEAYVQKLMKQYRHKKVYNTSTGQIDSSANIMSMIEDFWLTQPADGNSSDITNLGAGEALGEISDMDYFLRKLYRALQIPESRRLDSESRYNTGNIGDMTHQELKFSKMIDRISMKVKDLIFDIFKTHLKLKGLWDQYGLKDRDIRIIFNKNNHYEEFKEAQINETRLSNFGSAASYQGELLSKEFILKKYLMLTDEEIKRNKELMSKERSQGEDTSTVGQW
jgi:hypothetical protein